MPRSIAYYKAKEQALYKANTIESSSVYEPTTIIMRTSTTG
jgi:hypothetical protein